MGNVEQQLSKIEAYLNIWLRLENKIGYCGMAVYNMGHSQALCVTSHASYEKTRSLVDIWNAFLTDLMDTWIAIFSLFCDGSGLQQSVVGQYTQWGISRHWGTVRYALGMEQEVDSGVTEEVVY